MEEQQKQSLKKKSKATMVEREKETCFSSIGEDNQRNILSRLPASPFASAASVNRTLNSLCNQILSQPKLLSAHSFNSSIQIAVIETLDKVLSEPIRPDFAILFIKRRKSIDLDFCSGQLRKRLGFRIPIIISKSHGLIGTQVHINEGFVEDDKGGVVLTVGFMPGMKIRAIPFLLPIEEHTQVPMMDKFVEEIEEYSSSVSGFTSPTGIIMFTDHFFHLQLLLDKMDYALSWETVIAGGEGGCFLYNNGIGSSIFGGCKHVEEHQNTKSAAVALVFATDKTKSHGRIKFDLAFANGVVPVGPTFKGASVRVTRDGTFDSSTWLTARIEGSLEILDGEQILQHIDNEVEDASTSFDLFIGVTKHRQYSIKSRKPKLISSLSFHEVIEGNEEYLLVKGGQIRTGDKFRFYLPDKKIARLAHGKVYEELRILKQSKQNGEEVVFGGLIFACSGRDELFKGKNVDSSAFLENFPGVPLAGMFCSGEIGRKSSILAKQDENGRNHHQPSLRVYSTMYLVMSYTPKPLGN